MTRTKAIKRLKDAKIKIKIPNAAVTARETNDALDMAIEALENENALLDKVLEIIDDWKMQGVEMITMNGSAYEHHVETLKKAVLALKEGEQE